MPGEGRGRLVQGLVPIGLMPVRRGSQASIQTRLVQLLVTFRTSRVAVGDAMQTAPPATEGARMHTARQREESPCP